MSVKRIGERPRVTAPFSDEAWTALDALGEKVDADLNKQRRAPDHGRRADFRVGRRLSGRANGTPTRSARPSATRADDLIRRLRDRFAPGGLLHYGQGKWYPGEPMPRWAFALYWRRDGVPVWRDQGLIMREQPARAASTDDAHRFAEGIAARSGVSTEYVQPLYEDPVERMLKQGLIPENFDPSDPKIDDPHERARILKLFDSHLGAPRGFVLPLQRWTAQAKPGWLSEIWRTRRGRLFLVPGDSPAGFRLPLQSLPFIGPADYPYMGPADPFAPRTPLSDPRLTHPIAARAFHGTAGPASSFAAACAGCFGDAARAPRDRSIGSRGAHGHVGRSARRPLVRLHAADRNAQRLS